ILLVSWTEGRTVRAWFVSVAGLAELAAASLSGLVFYERIVVPLLPSLKSVSLWWWILATSPLWIVAVVIGWYARSAFELDSSTAAGALGWQVYMYWASVTQRPGLENQPLAQVDPLIFWTVGPLVSAILLGVPSVAGYLARHVRDRQSEQPGT